MSRPRPAGASQSDPGFRRTTANAPVLLGARELTLRAERRHFRDRKVTARLVQDDIAAGEVTDSTAKLTVRGVFLLDCVNTVNTRSRGRAGMTKRPTGDSGAR